MSRKFTADKTLSKEAKKIQEEISKVMKTSLGTQMAEAKYSLIPAGWTDTSVKIVRATEDKSDSFFILNVVSGETFNPEPMTLEKCIASCTLSGIQYDLPKEQREEIELLDTMAALVYEFPEILDQYPDLAKKVKDLALSFCDSLSLLTLSGDSGLAQLKGSLKEKTRESDQIALEATKRKIKGIALTAVLGILNKVIEFKTRRIAKKVSISLDKSTE